jgi:trypsin
MILFGCLLSNSLCTNHEPKVVGGTEVTDRSNFPYQAYLLYIDTIPYCGATIITERHVLTAAHCCFPTASLAQPSEISVVTGNLELNDRSNVKQVENVMVHENYDRYSLYNDIAIIKISETFQPWTNNIRPIHLNIDDVDSGTCTVSGWGTTISGDNQMHDKLIYVEVPIVEKEKCRSTYLNAGISIGENRICAGTLGKDACQGDSGGPLVCSDKLTGVVSSGIDCGDAVYPGLYTEVAKYIEWIKLHTSDTTTSSTVASTFSTSTSKSTSTSTSSVSTDSTENNTNSTDTTTIVSSTPTQSSSTNNRMAFSVVLLTLIKIILVFYNL